MAEAGDIIRIARAGGVEVKRQGKDYVCRCPFHNENTPSCHLNPVLNSYNCFGCGRHGGYVELAAELKVDLDDVLGPLAQGGGARSAPAARAPEPPRPRPVPPEPEPALVEIPDLPRTTDDPTVRAYLERRLWDGAERLGLLRFPTPTEPVIKWGTNPDGSPRMVPAYSKGYRVGALLFDLAGHVSGLQMRRVTDDNPRFNTLGTGAFGARARIERARERVYLAEGMGDFLVLVQAEDRAFCPVIGIPGTATVEKLLRPCRWPRGLEVVICFDADHAGDKAAQLVADMVLSAGGKPVRGRPVPHA